MTLEQLQEAKDSRFQVRQYKGVAFYFYGPEIERYWDEDEGISWDEPEERETGRVLMVMVGDDYKHRIDPEDVSVIPQDSYCRDCGQIGCGSNVYE